jgi:hypothetical protein
MSQETVNEKSVSGELTPERCAEILEAVRLAIGFMEYCSAHNIGSFSVWQRVGVQASVHWPGCSVANTRRN